MRINDLPGQYSVAKDFSPKSPLAQLIIFKCPLITRKRFSVDILNTTSIFRC